MAGFLSSAVLFILFIISLCMVDKLRSTAGRTQQAPLNRFQQSISLKNLISEPRELGEFCSPWEKCNSELACTTLQKDDSFSLGVCTKLVDIGGHCAGPNAQCAKNAYCARGTCRFRATIGGRCGPGGTCGYFLTCIKGICHKEGGYGVKCTKKFHRCLPNFICVNGRCKYALHHREKCGNRYSHCVRSLNCENWGMNGKVCVRILRLNEACPKDYARCRFGYHCNGIRCEAGLSKGAKCSPSRGFWCKRGLRCIQLKGIGARCVAVVKGGAKCNQKNFEQCTRGYRCVESLGKLGERHCILLLGDGRRCGPDLPRYIKCNRGLHCINALGNLKCAPVGKASEDCAGDIKRCDRNFRNLAGNESNEGIINKKKIIATPVSGLNLRCGGQYGECSRGLVCLVGRCVLFAGLNKKCDGKNIYCKTRLVCVKRGHDTRCLRVVNIGSFCRYPKHKHVICRRGLTCAGTSSYARCLAFLGSKSKCGVKYTHCKQGLSCVSRQGRRECSDYSENETFVAL